MNESRIGLYILLIVIAVLVVMWLWRKFVHPVKVTHDNSVAFVGGIGSGKSLNSVRTGIKTIKRELRAWRKECRRVRRHRWLYVHIFESFGLFANWNDEIEPERPEFLSNIPVTFHSGFFHKEYSCKLTRDHITFKKRIPEGSVVLWDEFPQFVTQFDYGLPLVKNELSHFMTFFRHYINGTLILNAQSLDEIECHVRRKLNCYYYCFDFQPFLFIFFRVRLLRCRVGDMSLSADNQYLDDNSKWTYGLLWPRHYDSRCYRHRYDKVTNNEQALWDDLCTNEIIRVDSKVKGVLDD